MALHAQRREGHQHRQPGRHPAAEDAILDLMDKTSAKISINGVYVGIARGERLAAPRPGRGDTIGAQFYLPKGTKADVLGYWYPEKQGNYDVDNDTMTVTSSAARPVLAHKFLDWFQNPAHAIPNFEDWNGYQPPAEVDRPERSGQGPGRAAVARARRRASQRLQDGPVHQRADRPRTTSAGRMRGRRSRPVDSGVGLGALEEQDTRKRKRRERKGKGPSGAGGDESGVWYPRWFWPSFAGPANLWMLVLFLVPLYVVFALAFGTSDPIFRNPLPVYEPWYWSVSPFKVALGRLFGVNHTSAFWFPVFVAHLRLRGRRQPHLRRHGLRGGVLRGALRRQAQGPVPGPADRAVLDQLPDADASRGQSLLQLDGYVNRILDVAAPHLGPASTGWAANPSR